jgi:hypothetical protein
MAWSVYPDQTAGAPSLGLQVGSHGAGGGWALLGPLVPEQNGTPFNPHRLVLNPDSHQLGASTTPTSNSIAAVYEYNATTSGWAMVCAPMPDFNQLDDVAKLLYDTGLAYDSVHHAYVLAAGSYNLSADTRFFVARIKP